MSAPVEVTRTAGAFLGKILVMSPEDVGQQFIHLFRGLAGVKGPRGVHFPAIGPHWTPRREVAESFALSQSYGEDSGQDITPQGVVISARVNRDNIIDPNSEEGKEWKEGEAVFDREHTEREHTVRPGSPITIEGVSHVKFNPNTWIGMDEREFIRFPKQGNA